MFAKKKFVRRSRFPCAPLSPHISMLLVWDGLSAKRLRKKSSFLHGCASVSQDNIELGGGQGGVMANCDEVPTNFFFANTGMGKQCRMDLQSDAAE